MTEQNLYHVPADAFFQRVFTSGERVSFSSADPFGHLSTSRFLEFFVNHRVAAIEDQIGFATMAMAKEQHIGLFFARSEVHYLRQAMLGEALTVASWVSSFDESEFHISGIIFGTTKRDLKAVVHANLKAVSLQTGRAVPMPATFPATSENAIYSLPLALDFLKDFKIPHGMLQGTAKPITDVGK